jgi:hypothetical protein
VAPLGEPSTAPAAPAGAPAEWRASSAAPGAAAVASSHVEASSVSFSSDHDGGPTTDSRAHHRDTTGASWPPVLGPASASGTGFSPAPGGGGAVGVAADLFKLATPAQDGSQMPTPILGRSVAFLEPPDRPG